VSALAAEPNRDGPSEPPAYSFSLILLFGVALRICSPAFRADLWYDETYSLTIARLPYSKMWQSLLMGADANPPLYTLLLRLWLKLGDSDAHIKSLSLIFGIAAIPLMYALARRIGGPRLGTRLGMSAALMMAASPAAIIYSGQARSYALFFFLSLLSTHLLLSIILSDGVSDRRSARIFTWTRCAGYALVTSLTVYTHWFGLLLIGVQIIALVIYRPSRGRVLQVIISLFVVGLCCLPLIPFYRNQVALRRAAGGFLWPGRPGFHSLVSLASFLFGGQASLWLAVLIFIVALAVGRRGESNGDNPDRSHRLFFTTYLLFPVILVFALSRTLDHYSFFVPRYFLPFMAAAPILLAFGLLALKPRFAYVLLAVLVLSPVLKSIKEMKRNPASVTVYSSAERELEAQEDGESLVVHLSPMSFYPMLHYEAADAATEKVLLDRRRRSSFPVQITMAGGLLNRDDLIDIATLGNQKDFWVVIDPLDRDPAVGALWSSLRQDARFSVDPEQRVGNLLIEHMTAKAPKRPGPLALARKQARAAKRIARGEPTNRESIDESSGVDETKSTAAEN
jgi:hypothetical protein